MQEKVVMPVIANASNCGTEMRINPKGKINDSQFKLVMVHDVGLDELIKMMRGVENFNKGKVKILQAREAKVAISPPGIFK